MKLEYPEYLKELKSLNIKLSKAIPGPMSGMGQLHKTALNDGALNGQTKELIALGIAIAIRCDGCIAYHTHDALKAGASHEEIVETIGVALLMGGGPSMIYGCEALKALEQFESQSK